MSKINELIDEMIFIKDGTKDMSERKAINEVCGILAKIERGELVEVVRCEECIYHADISYHFCKKLHIKCPNDSEFYCKFGRSGENV